MKVALPLKLILNVQRPLINQLQVLPPLIDALHTMYRENAVVLQHLFEFIAMQGQSLLIRDQGKEFSQLAHTLFSG